MKITAGLGSVEEYERFVRAGADEFFSGYVPYEWAKKYGTVMPLNRREVLAYNVQIGSFSEMEILSAMVKEYGRPVHLTFNSLYYIPEQYPEIVEIIKRCMEIGFHSYIIADPALILYLRQNNIDCEIHLSGETAEVNRGMVDFFQKLKLKRVIFHRKNTIKDMQSIIAYQIITETEQSGHVQNVMPEQSRMEFEAFILNELCQFTGAFCNSLHCDEMGYLCRVPYRLGTVKQNGQQAETMEREFFNFLPIKKVRFKRAFFVFLILFRFDKNRQNSTNGNKKKTKKQLILPEGSCRKVFHGTPTVISAARRAADCVRYISCRKQGSHTSNWLAEETIQTLWKKIFGIFGEL